MKASKPLENCCPDPVESALPAQPPKPSHRTAPLATCECGAVLCSYSDSTWRFGGNGVWKHLHEPAPPKQQTAI